MQGTPITLQLDILFDTFPGLLGPVLVFFGVEMILAGTFKQSLTEMGVFSELTKRDQFIVIGGFAVGLLFVVSGTLRQFGLLEPYVVFLFCVGRVIEGAGTVRFYRRVIDFIEGRRSGGGLKKRVQYGLLVLFCFVLGGWVAFRILTQGPLIGTVNQSLRLVWTAFITIVASLGIARKLRFARGDLNRGLVTGLVLCVAGAEVFNYATLSMDILSYLSGLVAYSIGFWVAALLLFKHELPHLRAIIPYS